MSEFSLVNIILSLLLSFGLSLIISFVYDRTNKGFSYESSFTFTLMFVCVIVTSIMITIGSNIALSLGLIGSLSIIRFRTVIKNTLDMAYLFWSISVGLAVGAHNYYMAVGCVIFLSVLALMVKKLNFFTQGNTDYVVVVQMHPEKENSDNGKTISNLLDKEALTWKIRSSFADSQTKEITYSVYSKNSTDIEKLQDQISQLSFIKKVSFLSPETNLFI